MSTPLKNKILETILSNKSFQCIAVYTIYCEESNFISSDNRAMLSEDNLVFLGNDSGLQTNDTYFVSNYTTDEIETILTSIHEY